MRLGKPDGGSAKKRSHPLRKRAPAIDFKTMLRDETREFFAKHCDNRQESRAFQKASIKCWGP